MATVLSFIIKNLAMAVVLVLIIAVAMLLAPGVVLFCFTMVGMQALLQGVEFAGDVIDTMHWYEILVGILIGSYVFYYFLFQIIDPWK